MTSQPSEERPELQEGHGQVHLASGQVWRVERVEFGAHVIATRDGGSEKRRLAIPYWLDEHQWKSAADRDGTSHKTQKPQEDCP